MNWLIDDARRAWRFLSVQLAALLALVATAWDYMPALQQYLDPAWVKYAALAILVARLWKQTPKELPVDITNEAFRSK